ncbi:MAG TPA: DUF1573 domain-containing protein [Thermoanaerobaculaceae bacterium]|nr:DUF1573 domain-containing protein [Thermoanaerobaculaceae bacterium]
MRRITLGAIAAVVVTTAAWAQQQPPQNNSPAQPPAAAKAPGAKAPEGPKPVIDIAEKIKDFGTVPKGEKINAAFEVHNTGAAPLEISQVRPTCGCTVASFDRTIAPGATGKIVAEVDTTGFSGPISKAIIVFSNDPATPQVNLVIKAEVRAFIEALPRPLIIFRSVLQGEPATEKLTLVSADGSDFKVESAAASGGPYKIAYRELPEKERIADRKGSQWELTVTVPADAPEGMLNQKILVKTTSPKAPEVTINVTGAVRPVVQVIPGEVNFGTVDGTALVGRNVLIINNRQGSELQLTDVKTDNPNFTTEVTPLQAGQRYQVAVSMKAGVPKGAQKASLKIATNDPLRKSIEIPIQAVVQ